MTGQVPQNGTGNYVAPYSPPILRR
jgi:hypothetical protein